MLRTEVALGSLGEMLRCSQQAAPVLLKEVMRRTGLTRMQLRYLEARGLIDVARSDGRRLFTERQVTLLSLLAAFRELGATLDDAAALASERLGGDTRVPEDRLDALFDLAIANSERNVHATVELREIKRRRLSGVVPSLQVGRYQLSNGYAKTSGEVRQ